MAEVPGAPSDGALPSGASPPRTAARGASAPPLAGVTAVYGGSFDPPHMGHQMACLYLLEALGAEAVWLVPTASHAFGKALRPFAHRVAMARLLAAPLDPRVAVCPIEGELGGLSTTHATVEHLAARYPARRWGVVVGADLVADLPRWHQAEALFERAGLVVLGRGGVAPPDPQVTFPPRPWLADATLALPEVSSTALRAKLARGENVAGWMPHAVAAYAQDRGLYAAPSA